MMVLAPDHRADAASPTYKGIMVCMLPPLPFVFAFALGFGVASGVAGAGSSVAGFTVSL